MENIDGGEYHTSDDSIYMTPDQTSSVMSPTK